MYNLMKSQKEMGLTSTKRMLGRKGNISTKRLVGIFRKNVFRNSRRSMRKKKSDLHGSRRATGRIVKDRLCLKPYKIRRRQLISEASNKKGYIEPKAVAGDVRCR